MANIFKRLTLGRPLTNAEIDQNFDNLNNAKAELSGTTPMTGNLSTPGLKATTLADGIRLYNFEDELVATFGKNGTQDIIIEGGLQIKGESVNADINVRNIYINGRIISTELRTQYKVSNVGDVYLGTAASVSNKLEVTLDTVVKIINKLGTFVVGQTVTGLSSTFSGVVSKVTSDTVYVRMTLPDTQFTVGESLVQTGSGGGISATVYEVINTNNFDVTSKVKVFGATAGASAVVTSGQVYTVSTLGSNLAQWQAFFSSLSAPPSIGQIITATASGSIDGGGTVTTTTAVDPASNFIAEKVGNLTGPQSTYYYWITQFRFATGQISAAEQVTAPVSHGAISLFNSDNNIKLTLARTSTQYGIAVYRGTTVNIAQAALIDVLTPGDLADLLVNIIYTDYGTNANTPWSTKDSSGRYTANSGMVHFPLTPNEVELNGWKYFTVEAIVNKSKIRFTENALLNAGGIVELVHNNTEGIQLAIDTNKTLTLNNLVLPNGTYYTSRLNLPDDFSLIGSGEQTIIKQLPWNFDNTNDVITPQNKGNIFKGKTTTPKNVTIKDIKIDGNIVNGVKYQEIGSNYVVALANGVNIDIDKVKIESVSGGGLYLLNSNNLRVQDCDILNGSISYVRDNVAPIYATGSSRITITSNVCENFVSPLDVSVCNIGVVTNNTIRNCGSGLLVYGSGNLLSSPNLLMGPSDEYLPSPDTQDSDFNSINITINPGVDYTSPSHLYMTRGEPLHLGSDPKKNTLGVDIPGTEIVLESEIFVLTKLNNSEVQRVAAPFNYSNNGGSPIINIITPNIDAGGYGRNDGYFQFRVTQANSLVLPTLPQLITTHGSSLEVGEQIVGLAYRIKGTGYKYTDVGERINISAGVFSPNPYTSGNKFYTVTLSDINNFEIFTVGDVVKIFGHSSTPDINGLECTITEKLTGGRFKLQLPSATNFSSLTNGTTPGGYITIRDTEILTKGRIL
jgi:hypothetical protein